MLQRTIQSFGRSKKVASGGPDDVPEYPQRLSVSVYLSLAGSPNALGFNQDDEDGYGIDYSSGGEFMEERTSLGCSGGAFTTLRQGGGGGGSFVDEYVKKISGFRNTKPTTTTTTTTAHVIADRADMYLIDDLNENPLVYPSASSCMIEITPQESFSCSVSSDENMQSGAMITLGWPLMHHSLGFQVKQQVEYLEDGKIPVVNWALQLPQEERLSLKSNNSKLFLAEELVDSECEKLMEGYMTPGASFVTHEFQKELISRCPSQLSVNGDEFYSARIRFSINMHATTSSSTSGSRRFDVDRSSLLQQKVETLSVDQLYVKFSFEELEVATASFSPSKNTQIPICYHGIQSTIHVECLLEKMMIPNTTCLEKGFWVY